MEEEKSPHAKERAAQAHARSRRIGFSRFYGQRVVDSLRRVYGRRQERTPMQRSALFVTAALAAVAVYAGSAGIFLRPPSIGTDLAGRLDQGRPAELADLGLLGDPSELDREALESALDAALTGPVEGDLFHDNAQIPDGSDSAHGTEVAEAVTLDAHDEVEAIEAVQALRSSDPAEAAPVAQGVVAALPSGLGSSSDRQDVASGAPTPPSAARPQASLPPASITSMALPATGELIQPYGWYRHPVFGDWRHTSSVVLKPAEDGLVRAALAGRVRDVVYEGGIWRIRIEHSGGWSTEYAGMLDVAVGSFEVVETGQVIGHIDPHVGWGVNFAVRQGEVAVNPFSLIAEEAVPASTD